MQSERAQVPFMVTIGAMSSSALRALLRALSGSFFFAIIFFAVALLCAQIASAHGELDPRSSGFENATPNDLADVGIDDHLGNKIDLDLTFKNEDGETVALSSFVRDRKPVLLSLAYFSCPSLCNFHLNGLNDAFKQIKEPLGSQFEVVVVSIEPKETPALAKQKRSAYAEAYGRPEGLTGWHFLTGSEANIHQLAKQVGFRYHWDEKEKQWAHASAAYAVTPDGRLSRYFYGITFDPKFLRLSMIEASNGFIGTIVDKLTLFCFHFDAKENKYTLAAFNIMRAGGGLTVLVMAAFLVPFWVRGRKQSSAVIEPKSATDNDRRSSKGEA